MELLPRRLSDRYLEPVNTERKILDQVDSLLATIDIPPIALPWYRAVAASRLSKMQALHSVGILHGECTNESLRLPGSIHDEPCRNFEMSYTFSRERPISVCGSMRVIPYRRLVELEEKFAVRTVSELYVLFFVSENCSDLHRATDRVFEKYLDEMQELHKLEDSGLTVDSPSKSSQQSSLLPLEVVVLRNVKTSQGEETSDLLLSCIDPVQNNLSSLPSPPLFPSSNIRLRSCHHKKCMKW